jgi:hypothetical protein
MDINQILNSKIKPDLTNLSNEQLLYLLNQNSIKINNQEDRNELVNKIYELWNNHSYFDSIDCPICLDIVTNSNHLITQCGHYFHTTCYTKYLIKCSSKNNDINCPQCRNNLITPFLDNNDSNQLIEYEQSVQSIEPVQTIQFNQNTNTNISNDNYYPNHQDMFFSPTSFFNSRYVDFTYAEYDDYEDIYDNYTFPINLHTGLWTSIGNTLNSSIISNFISRNNDNTYSESTTSSDDHSDDVSVDNSDDVSVDVSNDVSVDNSDGISDN